MLYIEPNDKLARRFFLDVVEDRERLTQLDYKGSADYFRWWLTGIDTSSAPHCEPRFSSCLGIDAESLASLAEIPDELPSLWCPATRKDKADTLDTGYPAWLWLVELKCMAQLACYYTDAYPRWLRIELSAGVIPVPLLLLRRTRPASATRYSSLLRAAQRGRGHPQRYPQGTTKSILKSVPKRTPRGKNGSVDYHTRLHALRLDTPPSWQIETT